MRKLQSVSFPLIALVFFILTFAIKVFIDGPYSRGEVSSAVAYIKYGTAAMACAFAWLYLFRKKKKKQIFLSEYKQMMLVAVLFTFITLMEQLGTGIYATTCYIELIKFAMPVILAFFMLNTLDFETFYKCMVILLWMSFIAYIIDLHNEGANVLDIFQADVASSESKTEHSGLSGISLAFVFFFTYFRRSRFLFLFSIFFCVCTFKRLALCFVAIALICKFFFPHVMSKKVSKSVLYTLKAGTVVVTGIWFWLMLPEQEHYVLAWSGKSTFDFTSGRSGMMRYLLDHSFKSYGFGSANDMINKLFGVPFEFDFIKIAFELSPLVLVIFICVFWNMSGHTFWGVCIIGFFVLNMITSDSLTSNFSMTLAYMVIGSINYYSQMIQNEKIFKGVENKG